MDTQKQKPPHVLVFPYPAQGHTLPLLALTHHLATRYHFTITIVTTPQNLPTLSPLLSSSPTTIHPLTLPFPSHPTLPPGIENVQSLGGRGNAPITAALTNLSNPISQWFHSQKHHPPVALISDFFLGWTSNLCTQLNIPRFGFFSSGCFLTSVNDYCWRNLLYSVHDIDETVEVPIPDLPGSVSFKKKHLPSIFKGYIESDPDWEIVKQGMFANLSDDTYGCIFNTFEDLEEKYLEFVKTKLVGHGRVFGVGPVSLIGPVQSDQGDDDQYSWLFSWLDGCPDGSVLYVCFGSQKSMTSEQMDALASGLEKSTTRFVWVVNTRTGSKSSVSDSFEKRVSGKGVVIKGWAPQVRILGHKAVGGFLSHCGWNSMLEGIVSGVVILGWPMEADQYVNARLLVEELGVGVRAWEGADSVPDPDELARVIGEWMRCEDVKVKAKELKQKALGAVGQGGSSWVDLDRLAQEILQLQVKRG